MDKLRIININDHFRDLTKMVELASDEKSIEKTTQKLPKKK
jgi:hypothetical protein